MAKNQSRSMNAELAQGSIDGRYMQLAPNWSVEAQPDVERMAWPTYGLVEQFQDRFSGNVRPVDTPEARAVQVARARLGAHTSAMPWDRPTKVDPGAYHGIG